MRNHYRFILAAAVLATAAFQAHAQSASSQGGITVRPWQSIHNPFTGGGITNPTPGSAKPMNTGKPFSLVRPVPEPSQWALMGAGLGLVAWIVRRRSKRTKD